MALKVVKVWPAPETLALYETVVTDRSLLGALTRDEWNDVWAVASWAGQKDRSSANRQRALRLLGEMEMQAERRAAGV